jgi:hypothetical protein
MKFLHKLQINNTNVAEGYRGQNLEDSGFDCG